MRSPVSTSRPSAQAADPQRGRERDASAVRPQRTRAVAETSPDSTATGLPPGSAAPAWTAARRATVSEQLVAQRGAPDTSSAGPWPALRRSADPGDRADAAPIIRRFWSEEQVYTVVRDQIPQWRQLLSTIDSEPDPWARRSRARALIPELDKEVTEGRQGAYYRLGRTHEYAAGAVEALQNLAAKARLCEQEAGIAITERIDKALGDFSGMEKEISQAFGKLRALADELEARPLNRPGPLEPPEGRKGREPVGSDAPSPSMLDETSRAEKVIITTLEPSEADLAELLRAGGAEREHYLAEIERLEEAKPVVVKFLEQRMTTSETLDDIERLLEGTTYKSKTTGPQLIQAKQRFAQITSRADKVRALTREDSLSVLTKAQQDLDRLDQDLRVKGGLGELAYDVREHADDEALRRGNRARGQRTTLPTKKKSEVGAAPQAQMLIEAVRESKKSPAWTQVAVDFVRDRLATGRVDHIHICGGGNTLIYRDRLIRGYMTKHLDSREESKLQHNKILKRETDKPVTVTVIGGILYEVVPDK